MNHYHADSETTTRTLALHELRRDDTIQPRVALAPGAVEDYAEQMKLGGHFPPVVVFEDGDDYWLADGYHRTAAAEQAGRNEIEAEIRQGTKADAMRYACSANTKHGLRMTNADKRHVTDKMLYLELDKPEEARLSQREIAALCGVTQAFVSNRAAVLFSPQPCKSAVMRTGSDELSDNGYQTQLPGEGITTDMAARIIKSVMRCLHPFKAMPLECIETVLTEAVEEIRRRIREAGN